MLFVSQCNIMLFFNQISTYLNLYLTLLIFEKEIIKDNVIFLLNLKNNINVLFNQTKHAIIQKTDYFTNYVFTL